MRPIALGIARSVVCVSVCVLVDHTNVLCNDSWTDRDAVWGADSCGSKEPCIRWGRDPPREGAVLEVVRPIVKHRDSVLRVGSKRDLSFLKNGMTVRPLTAAADCNVPGWWVSLHCLPWKIRPLRCGLIIRGQFYGRSTFWGLTSGYVLLKFLRIRERVRDTKWYGPPLSL